MLLRLLLYRYFTNVVAAVWLDVALQILLAVNCAAITVIAVVGVITDLYVVGAHKNEHHGQEQQPVIESKDHGQGDHLEEGNEDVRLGEGEEDDGKEGRDATVQYAGESFCIKVSGISLKFKKRRNKKKNAEEMEIFQ